MFFSPQFTENILHDSYGRSKVESLKSLTEQFPLALFRKANRKAKLASQTVGNIISHLGSSIHFW